MMSRRAFVAAGTSIGAVAVAGGAGAILVEERVLPGKVAFDRAIGRCRSLPEVPSAPGVVRARTFRSRRRGTGVTAVVVLPAGVTSPRGLPVAVALHGNGGTGWSAARGLRLDRYLTDAVRTRGTPPFALVAVDGGASTYWHRRANGDDPIAMIIDELLPLLARQGARTDRFGVIGWSMGGYGALVLAETAGAPRVAAAVASSPALFPSYENARRTNHGAFDGPADFARNDVFAGLRRMAGVPAWVDCGTSDPFAPMAERLRARLRPAGAMGRGCHDGAFWLRRLPPQLDFLGAHLAGH
jgi:S-formylglutathione hydrolase FrmB